MNNIAVIGAGMIGSLIYSELSASNKVDLFDLNNQPSIPNFKKLNILKDELDFLRAYDMIVLGIPGSIAFEALKRIGKLGVNTVDISFFPEDPSELNDLFKEHNAFLLHDCGVAPGFDNIALGYYESKMPIKTFVCMVGGLPLKPVAPFKYKAPFSPSDVIEEYVRPARFRREGKDITMPALSEIEHISHGRYGDLEAFNSDGLRSLLDSFPNIPNMVEKTIRYRGHADQMFFLREAGFFSDQYLDGTSKLLFDAWKLDPSDPEFTLMTIEIEAQSGKRIFIELSAERNAEGWSSMAQTTAFNCTAAAEWLLKNPVLSSGAYPPEKLGALDSYWSFLLDYLKSRRVQIAVTEQ